MTTQQAPSGAPVPPRRKRSASNPNGIAGRKRQRLGGSSWLNLGSSRPNASAEEWIRRAIRLPTDPATARQAKALEDLVLKHRRLQAMADNLNLGLSKEIVARIVGVKGRTAYAHASEIAAMPVRPDLQIIFEYLDGVFEGRFPGVIGSRKSGPTIWLFGQIDDYPPGRFNPQVLAAACEDPERFRFVHAGFRLDYRRWIGRRA